MKIFSHCKLLNLVRIVFMVFLAAAAFFLHSPAASALCVVSFIFMLFDFFMMDKMRKDYQMLYHSAYFDALTGIPNRLSADAYVEKCYADKHVCVAIADLDGLKEVNDSCGHQAGDELICRFAAIFSECASPAGFAARNGGDEFLAIFTGSDSIRNTETFLADLQEKIAACNTAAEHPLSYSIGSASAERDKCTDIYQVISIADRNMYIYKKKKKSERSVSL